MQCVDFAEQHAQRVKQLCLKLHEALILPDSGAYLAKTGSLLKSKTLRNKDTRKKFNVILEAAMETLNDESKGSRFWSKSVCLDAVKLLRQQHNLEVPQLPGFEWPKWFKTQASLIQELAKKANRNLRSSSSESLGSMEGGDETLPYEPEDGSIWGV